MASNRKTFCILRRKTFVRRPLKGVFLSVRLPARRRMGLSVPLPFPPSASFRLEARFSLGLFTAPDRIRPAGQSLLLGASAFPRFVWFLWSLAVHYLVSFSPIFSLPPARMARAPWHPSVVRRGLLVPPPLWTSFPPWNFFGPGCRRWLRT